MFLSIKDGGIFYKEKLLFAYDDFNEGFIDWKNVDYALEDISLRDLFIFIKGEPEQNAEKADEFLVKTYCLSLMWARNYGFLENIDLQKYKFIWLHYEKNPHPNDKEIFLAELITTEDIDDECTASYEESFVEKDKRYTLCATVDWHSVLSFVREFYETGEAEEIEEDHLMALGLMKARDQGLKEGKRF